MGIEKDDESIVHDNNSVVYNSQDKDEDESFESSKDSEVSQDKQEGNLSPRMSSDSLKSEFSDITKKEDSKQDELEIIPDIGILNS